MDGSSCLPECFVCISDCEQGEDQFVAARASGMLKAERQDLDRWPFWTSSTSSTVRCQLKVAQCSSLSAER